MSSRPALGTVAKRAASLARPSVSTGGGCDIARDMSATPRALMRSIVMTMLQAASQVWGTALFGQPLPTPAPGPPAVTAGPPVVPARRQAWVAVVRHEEGAKSSRSGIAGYQSFRGPPNDGR